MNSGDSGTTTRSARYGKKPRPGSPTNSAWAEVLQALQGVRAVTTELGLRSGRPSHACFTLQPLPVPSQAVVRRRASSSTRATIGWVSSETWYSLSVGDGTVMVPFVQGTPRFAQTGLLDCRHCCLPPEERNKRSMRRSTKPVSKLHKATELVQTRTPKVE